MHEKPKTLLINILGTVLPKKKCTVYTIIFICYLKRARARIRM